MTNNMIRRMLWSVSGNLTAGKVAMGLHGNSSSDGENVNEPPRM